MHHDKAAAAPQRLSLFETPPLTHLLCWENARKSFADPGGRSRRYLQGEVQTMLRSKFAVAFLLCTLGCVPKVTAQMIHTASPAVQMQSGFHENMALGWSINGKNFFANSGAPPSVPFGGADPNAALSGGVGFSGGGVRGSLGFSFGQGSRQSISSTTPSITTQNGSPGNISSQTIRPFVTGVTPVIGGYSYGVPTRDNVSRQMLQSYQQGQRVELNRRAAANARSKQQHAQESFARGVRAEEDGNLRMARANFRRALALDQGPLRQEILRRLKRY